jgi:hypothetical protein
VFLELGAGLIKEAMLSAEKSRLTTESSDKGKPGENRGRKTMGLRLIFS